MILLWLIIACGVVLGCGYALGYYFGHADGRRERAYEEWHARATAKPTSMKPFDQDKE